MAPVMDRLFPFPFKGEENGMRPRVRGFQTEVRGKEAQAFLACPAPEKEALRAPPSANASHASNSYLSGIPTSFPTSRMVSNGGRRYTIRTEPQSCVSNDIERAF
jgi:hypothetical protein